MYVARYVACMGSSRPLGLAEWLAWLGRVIPMHEYLRKSFRKECTWSLYVQMNCTRATMGRGHPSQEGQAELEPGLHLEHHRGQGKARHRPDSEAQA